MWACGDGKKSEKTAVDAVHSQPCEIKPNLFGQGGLSGNVLHPVQHQPFMHGA